MEVTKKKDDANDQGIDPFKQAMTIASACNKVFRQFREAKYYWYHSTWRISSKREAVNDCLERIKWLSKQNQIHIQHARIRVEYKVQQYKVDGYCRDTNTVFEFNGCKRHGCPKCIVHRRKQKTLKLQCTLVEAYERTLKKKKKIIEAGYT